jgi:hypothetical protein
MFAFAGRSIRRRPIYLLASLPGRSHKAPVVHRRDGGRRHRDCGGVLFVGSTDDNRFRAVEATNGAVTREAIRPGHHQPGRRLSRQDGRTGPAKSSPSGKRKQEPEHNQRPAHTHGPRETDEQSRNEIPQSGRVLPFRWEMQTTSLAPATFP